MDNAQGRHETDAERMARAPNVLEAYARDIDRHGKPLDSGLATFLLFVADQLRSAQVPKSVPSPSPTQDRGASIS